MVRSEVRAVFVTRDEKVEPSSRVAPTKTNFIIRLGGLLLGFEVSQQGSMKFIGKPAANEGQ
jgi:hypothetical protein